MKNKISIKNILPILYAILLAFSFYLDFYDFLFCLSLPWSIFTSFTFILVHSHSSSNYFGYWTITGGILNLVIWMCVLMIRANNPPTSNNKPDY